MWQLLDSLRGARRLGLFAALAAIALTGLLLLGSGRDAPAAGRTALEMRLESVLGQIDGVGDVRVMIAQDDGGAAVGAVVVCSGLDGVRGYLEIQSAVQALLGVETARIRIIGKGGFGGAVP